MVADALTGETRDVVIAVLEVSVAINELVEAVNAAEIEERKTA